MSEEDEQKAEQSKPPRLEDRPIDVTPEPPRPAEPATPPPADDQSRS